MSQKFVVVPWDRYLLLTEDRPPSQSKDQVGAGTSSLSVQDILNAVPKQNRRDAEAILHHMQRAPNIYWNDKGELVVNEETRTHTHINDLLKDAFYKYKHWEPEGVNVFYQTLAESNLPAGLIKNPERRKLLQTYKDPRPPGVLASSWLTWD